MDSNFVRKVKEKIPDLLMYCGEGGHIIACVWTGFATMKVPGILDAYRTSKAEAEAIADEDARKKALLKVKAHLAWELTKNYAGPAIIEGASAVGQFSAYGSVKKTCAGLAATVAAMDGTIKLLQSRTAEEVGEEKANDIWLGAKEEVVEPEEKNEDGEVVKEAKTEKVYDSQLPSPYAVWFCPEDYTGAELNLDYNGTFLSLQEKLFKNYLDHGVKIIFWNDVQKELGAKKLSAAGNHVGWPAGSTIDFRARLAFRRKEDGTLERCWMLDPNVVGNAEEIALERGYIKKF